MAVPTKKNVIQDLNAKNQSRIHGIQLGDVIGDFAKLDGACLMAKNAGVHVEVTEDLFDQLANGADTDTICYGAVELYREGSVEKIKAYRNLRVEDAPTIGSWRNVDLPAPKIPPRAPEKQ